MARNGRGLVSGGLIRSLGEELAVLSPEEQIAFLDAYCIGLAFNDFGVQRVLNEDIQRADNLLPEQCRAGQSFNNAHFFTKLRIKKLLFVRVRLIQLHHPLQVDLFLLS